MKNNWLKLSCVVALSIGSQLSYGQKMKEQDAAMAYKNTFMTAMGDQDLEAAKKALLKGKEAIDLAATNPETMNNQKTLFYKAAIYSAFYQVGAMSGDSNFVKNNVGDNGLDIAAESLKKAFNTQGKMKSEVEELAKQSQGILMNVGATAYNAGMYKDAAEAYMLEAKFADAINEIDTVGYYYAANSFEKAGDYSNAAETFAKVARLGYKGPLCYALASTSYRKIQKYEESKNIIIEARAKYPVDKDLILESVNTYLDLKDPQGAEKSLNEAIAKDPNNKILHFVVGTVYSDLKQNDKAEASLNKAIELDPNYDDALYQLGAVLIGWGGEYKKQINDLKPGDKREAALTKEMNDIYKRALTPLDKYISRHPNDKEVLMIVSKLYRSLGDMTKSAEYKAKADAIK